MPHHKDIPLPASLNEQLYEEVTPLEAFVWEGKEASDLSLEHKAKMRAMVLKAPLFEKTKTGSLKKPPTGRVACENPRHPTMKECTLSRTGVCYGKVRMGHGPR